jgi:hypothetical protein
MGLALSKRGGGRRVARRVGLFALALLATVGYVAWQRLASSRAIALHRERHPQSTWASCNRNAHNSRKSTFRTLSDRSAASLVTHQRESRVYNARAYRVAGRAYRSTNSYVPNMQELRRFRRSRTSDGRTVAQFNPYLAYVDGRDGLHHPSTDDLIQWAAHKWGIPEDWLRAQYVQESYWNSFQLGDEAAIKSAWYQRYPLQARVPNHFSAFQSMGLTQVKWVPDGSVGPGSEPLRWESTAFNVDYQAAMVRFYYDNPSGARSAWGDSQYVPCQPWNSIGGWFEPYPWGNGGQGQYIRAVQQHLAGQDWTRADFIHWTPGSFPPGIRFK